MRRVLLVLLSTSLAACGQGLLEPVTPSVAADAGADRRAAVGEPVALDGSASRVAPLEIWLADGQGANENQLLLYTDEQGLQAIGPLRTGRGTAYAFPSDLVAVGQEVYGVDTYRRRIFRLTTATGQVEPIGEASAYRTLSALAYDARDDLLYVADRQTRRLLVADRGTGEIRSFGIELPGQNVRGLAFDPAARVLYGCDGELNLLYRVDPQDGIWSSFHKLPTRGDGSYDELAFHAGRLYGLYREVRGGTAYVQLRRIDPETGDAVDVGPEIPRASARSLLIRSAPQPARWTLDDGPGEAVFEAPHALSTRVRFARPGRYELRLSIEGESEPVSDSVVVHVAESASG